MSIYLDLEWSKKLKTAGIEFKGVPAPTLEELLNMLEGNYGILEVGMSLFGEERSKKFRLIFWQEDKVFKNTDPKITVAEALLWQKGEGR